MANLTRTDGGRRVAGVLACGMLLSGCALARVAPDGTVTAAVLGHARVLACEPEGSLGMGSPDGALIAHGPCVVVTGGSLSTTWVGTLAALGTIAGALGAAGAF